MPRLVYEYIYVNMLILFFLALFWSNDGYISFREGSLLIVISIVGVAFVGKKQMRPPGTFRIRNPFK